MGMSLAARRKVRFTSGRYLNSLFAQQSLVMEDELNKEIRDRMKRARLAAKSGPSKKGLTQQDVADLLGVTLGAYQQFEGRRVPLKRIPQIADALGVEARWLLHGTAPVPPPRLEQQVADLDAKIDRLLDQMTRWEERNG